MALKRDAPARESGQAKLGRWHLLSLALSGVIGSGWLLAIPPTAKEYGGSWPIALLSWLVAAGVVGLLATVVIRLTTARPQSGGLIRWPTDSSGRAVGTIMGAGLIVVYAGNPPAAAAAVVQALDGHFGFGERSLANCEGDAISLTIPGQLVAIAVLTGLFGVNLLGLRLLTRVNTFVTAVKVAIPVVVVLGMVGYQLAGATDKLSPTSGLCMAESNLALPVVDVLTTAGIIFALTGFQGPVDHAGHADPRQFRFAVLGGVAVPAVIYMALQAGYLWAGLQGWPSADENDWLGHVILLGMVLSPLGTAMVFISFTGESLKTTAEKRLVITPVLDMSKVSRSRGVPWAALAWSYFVGIALLSLFGGWAQIATAKTVIFLFVYSFAAISYTVFRETCDPAEKAAKYPASLRLLGPLSVALATAIAYYSGFDRLLASYAFLFALGLIMLASRLLTIDTHYYEHLRRGWWLLGYFVLLLGLAWVTDLLTAYYGDQWESQGPLWLVVLGAAAAALGVAAYYIGVRQSLKFLGAAER